MQASEHTFPLPSAEVEKLDVVQHQIEEPPASKGSPVTEFFQANKWSLIVFGVLGGAIGWALSSRPSKEE